ncbi:SRPBCC family protein [Mycobacterium sherrisii]|uniref:Cyclase n=1 Tax=Mycobacterium sherrisii TaxID=243061 RepID=A0A1E3SGZ4_9MYCO|nr:SRPBCC family protein [Mycobacterium sherrisii]MCV7032108.1 SRPBCC family protein [Mycobacterium sherrisii]MEC4765123.1 SRPBCC family protein [Mycobacterium sherrisii]ODR01411.1 cyclase [Mycobacterium sherrisii]ORW80251.1 cyclase [Mycobacterium sherrisii]
MAHIQRSRVIAARPRQVWDVLADFGAIGSWADNVDHSCILASGADGCPLGTTRRVQVKRDTLVERIIEFDPPHVLAYDIEGLPRLLGRVSNRWALAPNAPEATAVTLTSTVEIGSRPHQKLAERLVCRVMARQSDSMLAGLANRLENARV